MDIAKIFQTKFPESKLIDDKIGWAIYTLFIKDFDPDKGDFAKLHQNIRFIVEKATEGRFSPKRLAVLKSVEILLKKNRSKDDIESASAYLDALDRSKLSAEEKQTTNRGRVLKNINKITTLADTAYRYNFNDICRYETSQLGVFQKENGTFEVHQFIVKN